MNTLEKVAESNRIEGIFRAPTSAEIAEHERFVRVDGNGRSGRALWYWMMAMHPQEPLGFLHAFYYQTLQQKRLRSASDCRNRGDT